MSNITFTMIKPDAVADGHIGAILAKINEAGFTIKAMKMTKLSAEKAGQFLPQARPGKSQKAVPHQSIQAKNQSLKVLFD